MSTPSASTPAHLPIEAGAQDGQLVTPDGTTVAAAIDGVLLRPTVTHTDERGELAEILSDAWPEALGMTIPHVYMATILPGVVKGWISHGSQHDRSVILFGRLRWVLYDGREDSPTRGLVQTVTLTERNRHLIVLPPGVWHAVENVGTTEAAFANLPTRAYRYHEPDKYRLPLDTDEIPFRFPPRR